MDEYASHRSCLVADVRPGVEEVERVDHIGVAQQRSFVELPNLKMRTNFNKNVLNSFEGVKAQFSYASLLLGSDQRTHIGFLEITL